VATQSLIPSFEDIKLHSADMVAGDVIDTLQSEIKAFETLANPDICDEKYLPFLAYAFKVDFWDDNLNIESKRKLIKSSLLLHQKKGTIWAIEEILAALDVKADVSEWFEYGGEPYYFKIKIDIQQQFPNINQLANLIDVYKNVRSKYEIDFDVETSSLYEELSALSVDIDYIKGLDIDKSSNFSCKANNNYKADFSAIIEFGKEAILTSQTASAFDVETRRDFFDVERFSNVKNQAIANMRLDFSYNDSDVMHLPIPPIVVSTKMTDSPSAIFIMDFSQNSPDVFHLDYSKDYEVNGGVEIENGGLLDMDFYDGGIKLNTTTTTLFVNANSVNLDI